VALSMVDAVVVEAVDGVVSVVMTSDKCSVPGLSPTARSCLWPWSRSLRRVHAFKAELAINCVA
jgi:hypothetical protein